MSQTQKQTIAKKYGVTPEYISKEAWRIVENYKKVKEAQEYVDQVVIKSLPEELVFNCLIDGRN